MAAYGSFIPDEPPNLLYPPPWPNPP